MRGWTIALAVGLLAACGGPEPPDPGIVERLSGTWRATDGSGTLRIWSDGAVKIDLRIAEERIRLLTQLERLKDGVGMPIGDRWAGPARLRLDREALIVVWPSDPPTELRLVRAASPR